MFFKFKVKLKVFCTTLLITFLFLVEASAQQGRASETSSRRKVKERIHRGGTYAIGGAVAFSSVAQNGINQAIRSARSLSAATTSELHLSNEYMVYLIYKVQSYPISIQLRPSYYTQFSDGTGNGGRFSYELTGYTVFPLVRYIPFSWGMFDFYIQAGMGYGSLEGRITNGSRRVSFSGTGFGAQGGIGTDFCFFLEHCLGAEGSYRYLPIPRSTISSSSGTLPPDGIAENTYGRELENQNLNDIATGMTGLTGMITYTYSF